MTEHRSSIKFTRIWPESQKALLGILTIVTRLFSPERTIILNSSTMVYVYSFLYIIQIELCSTFLCIASFTQYYVCEIYLCVACSCSFKECRVMLHLPTRGVSHKLFGAVLHGRFIYSLPFIYLVISLYQYGLLDISFIIWFIIQHYFIYFAQIIPALDLFCSSFSYFFPPDGSIDYRFDFSSFLM